MLDNRRGLRSRLGLAAGRTAGGGAAFSYSPWRCTNCGESDLTRVQQTSKCHGTGRCYWCGNKIAVVRDYVGTTMTNTFSERGRRIHVLIVRRFEATSVTMGVGFDDEGGQSADGTARTGSWYVFDQVDGEPWHRHCGPYANMPDAMDWINAIRDSGAPAPLVREGHRQ